MADHWRSGGATQMVYGDYSPLRPVTFYSRRIKFEDQIRAYERNKKRERNSDILDPAPDPGLDASLPEGLT